MEIIQEMISKDLKLDVCTYNLLLEGLCSYGKLLGCVSHIEEKEIYDYELCLSV